jgi:hypothetical protein
VMTARVMKGPDAGSRGFRQDELFTDYEQLLFTKVVAVAEREGRPVRLLIVPSSEPYGAIAQTAFRLGSSEIVMGESANFSPRVLAQLVGDAWDKIPGTRARQVKLAVYTTDGRRESFNLGVHVPELKPADLDLIHELWLDAYRHIGPQVRHRDIVTAALRELASEISSERREAILARLKEQTQDNQ